jgi:hypothetical protein
VRTVRRRTDGVPPYAPVRSAPTGEPGLFFIAKVARWVDEQLDEQGMHPGGHT